MRKRRLSEAGRRRLMIALARAEETLVEAHVKNVLAIHESVGDELPLGRAADIYLEAVDPGEPHASIVMQRLMARVDGSPGGRGRRARRFRIEGDE
jgi:hypothetical protein